MILSAQTIKRLCQEQNMISPFIERQVVNGKSAGLSACSYDVRIKQDVILSPRNPYGWRSTFDPLSSSGIATMSGHAESAVLASTIEHFKIPDNVCGFVYDKSSYARVFMTAFNTLLDPGWEGFLTLELVNLGNSIIELKAGDPICQIVFHWLDEPTELPYRGKYQTQADEPVPAIFEK